MLGTLWVGRFCLSLYSCVGPFRKRLEGFLGDGPQCGYHVTQELIFLLAVWASSACLGRTPLTAVSNWVRNSCQ